LDATRPGTIDGGRPVTRISAACAAVIAAVPASTRSNTPRGFCREFFAYYNDEHRHSGIGLLAPAAVHYGRAEQTYTDRMRTLDAAYAATPERFVRRAPTPPAVPAAAWINEPKSEEAAH
jgi:putative transposase